MVINLSRPTNSDRIGKPITITNCNATLIVQAGGNRYAIGRGYAIIFAPTDDDKYNATATNATAGT